MEEQLQELSTKLAAMETEKHSLAARNKVLETALATAKGMPGKVSLYLSQLSIVGAVSGACDVAVCSVWHLSIPSLTSGGPQVGLLPINVKAF